MNQVPPHAPQLARARAQQRKCWVVFLATFCTSLAALNWNAPVWVALALCLTLVLDLAALLAAEIHILHLTRKPPQDQ